MDENVNRIENLVEQIAKILDRIEEICLLSETNSIGDWIEEKHLQRLTGISNSSLYRLRKSGSVLFSTITPRLIMYNKKSLIKFIEKNSRL